MKKLQSLLLLFSFLFTSPTFAQEYATRQIRVRAANEVRAGLPIDVTKESSEVVLRYGRLISSPWYYAGDYLTKLVFKGYNPGKEVERHLTVQVSTHYSKDNYYTVFDGNITIPQGGTADACIPMLTIDFSAPLLVENISPLKVKISCTGEPADTPVYFEQYVEETTCLPAALLTIQSEVAYFDRAVTNLDGNPIPGAQVTVCNDFLSYSAQTGDDGRFSIKVDDDNVEYQLIVTAPGYPDYVSGYFYLKEVPDPSPLAGSMPGDVVLTNKLDFTEGQQATIILPQAPDPSWGKYYRLDRHEGRNVIFERENEPKANTPYVIFPNEDFSLNLADYELSQLNDPEGVPFPDNAYNAHMGFFGSYKSQPARMDLYDGEYLYFLDSTPDCVDGASRDCRIGACRAYLVLGARSNVKLVYNDPTGLFEITNTVIATQLYDLLGRQLQDKPGKSLYIRDGKKYMVR